MYNRYIPQDVSYTWTEAEKPASPPQRNQTGRGGRSGGGFRLPDFLLGKEGLSAFFPTGEGKGLSSLLKTLHLENIDSGDLLLLLIMLYLLVEGDDLELVIALGLVLLMGLGKEE